jgi:putative salt-induced outer membrane protein YdiY
MSKLYNCAFGCFIVLSATFSTIARADEVLITLQSGDVIRGTLISDANGVVEIKHPNLGDLKIKRDAITKMVPAPAVPTEPTEPTAKTTPPAPTDAAAATTATPPAAEGSQPAKPLDVLGILQTAPPAEDPNAPKWKGQIELNATFVSAENTQLDLRAAAQATRETIDDKLKAYAEYYLRTLANSGSSGFGDVTDNNLLTNVTYDRFLNPTKWLWFGKTQYQYDVNQGWENRIQGWGGIGYRFYEDPKGFSLTGKVGLGATHEFGSIDTTQPNGYAEIALAWQISDRQKLNFSTYISPDLANIENFFVQTRLEWSMKLDIFSGLSLVTGLRDDYQSQPSDNGTGNDFRGYAGLKLEF